MKPVRLSRHAQQQLDFRGCSTAEVIDAIQTTVWEPAEFGRLQCHKNLAFRAEWNNIWYALKQVRP